MKTVKIKSIKKIPRKDRYDLTINSTHNFFANGILIHNTSGRTANIHVRESLPHWKCWVNKYFPHLAFKQKTYWQYVSGTRNTILDSSAGKKDTYYSDTAFRTVIHNQIVEKKLHKGETLYYEIVGYTDKGGQIIPSHHVEDKETKRIWGDTITYKYGCNPELGPQWRVLVYRITMTNEDGYVIEYPWARVKARCIELGMEHVPELDRFHYSGDKDKLINLVKSLSDGPDPLDPSHIREGVCLRVEDSAGEVDIFKWKSFLFTSLEGIRSNESQMDMEEEMSIEE